MLTGEIVRILFPLFALCLMSMESVATIESGEVLGGESLAEGGSFIKLEVPFDESDPDNTVGDDTFQNPNLYGFDEGQNIEITIDIAVDILADGSGGEAGSGILPAGTTVASHYVFFDPAGTTSQFGTVSFDSDILAVLTSTETLEASDFLINNGVNYLNPSLRGLESGDVVSISGLRDITVDWVASTPGDYVRVLTEFSPGAVVPLPPAIWLFSAGCMVLAGVGRRSRPQAEQARRDQRSAGSTALRSSVSSRSPSALSRSALMAGSAARSKWSRNPAAWACARAC